MGIVRAELSVMGSKAKEKLKVLFDTGATRSIIRGDIGRRLGAPRKLVIPRECLVSNGHKVKSRYSIDLAVKVGGKPVGIEAFLIENLPEQLVFGAIDMETYGIKLDLKRKRLDLSEFSTHVLAI